MVEGDLYIHIYISTYIEPIITIWLLCNFHCSQVVTGCDLKNVSLHMVFMCISVGACAEYNVQANSAGDLCIHALLNSYTSRIIF